MDTLKERFLRINCVLRQPSSDACVPTVVFSVLAYYNWAGLVQYKSCAEFRDFVYAHARRTGRWTQGQGIDLTDPFFFLKQINRTGGLADACFNNLPCKEKLLVTIRSLLSVGIPAIIAEKVGQRFHMLVALEYRENDGVLVVYDPAGGRREVCWNGLQTDDTNYRVYAIFPKCQLAAVQSLATADFTR